MKLFFFTSVIFCVCCITKILVLRQYTDGCPKYAKHDREKKERQREKESVRVREKEKKKKKGKKEKKETPMPQDAVTVLWDYFLIKLCIESA